MLGGLAATVFGLATTLPGWSAMAKNKDKRRRNKKANRRKNRKKNRKRQNDQPPQPPPSPQLNEFGCIDVGQLCFGRGDLCCSGICDGAPPQNGEPDARTCAAHNTGGCSPDQDFCTTDPNTRCGATGTCARTTGNAGFCLQPPPEDQLNCSACKRDADCTLGFGPGAACIVCEVACPETRTICVAPAA
jgi:hypothetical protein